MAVPIPVPLLALSATVFLSGCAALGLPAPLAADRAASAVVPGASPLALASPDPLASPGLVAAGDGVMIELPTGWRAVELVTVEPETIVELLALSEPELAPIVGAGLGVADARVSLVASDPWSGAPLPPTIALVEIPTRGLPREVARQGIEELLPTVPLLADPVRATAALPAGTAQRWELRVAAASGPLWVRADLIRVAGESWVFLAVAPDGWEGESLPAFDAILDSLRLGI